MSFVAPSFYPDAKKHGWLKRVVPFVFANYGRDRVQGGDKYFVEPGIRFHMTRQGFFRPDVVTRLLDDHVAGRQDLSRQLWGLLAFTLWHERHVEREPTQPRMPELLAER